MAQSSVEWLATYIKSISSLNHDEVIEQAKDMHRHEHEDAYIEGGKCIADGWAWTIEGRKEMAALHYYETFGDAAP